MKFFLSLLIILTTGALLNAQTPTQIIENTHTGKLIGFDINEDGTLMITGGIDNRAHLWNPETAEKLKSFMDNQSFATVEFNHNKTKIVTSNSNGKIIILDATTLKPATILKGNTSAIVSFAFHPNNELIAGISADGKVFIWDEKTRLIKSFESGESNIIKIGYSYNGSALIIASNQNISIWNAELFSKIRDLNYKAAIRDIDIANNSNTIAIAFNNSVKTVNIENIEDFKDIPTPKGEITSACFSPDDKYIAIGNKSGDILVISKESTSIVFDLKNVHDEISDLLFTNNGNKLFTSSSNGTIKVWDISKLGIISNNSMLALEQSNSHLEDKEYRGGDPLKGLGVNYTGKDLQFGKYYVLIIGIDNYKGIWPKLKNAVNDAQALEKVLKNKYKSDYIKTLYNEQATRVNIIKEMEWLVENVKPTDNLLIFYSGHGEYNEALRKGYWVPVDAANKSTSSYISNSDIQTFLGGIKSKHTLLISDACFSGDIFRGDTKTTPFEESDKYYAKVNNALSRKAITSGGIEPVLDGGQNGHSIFSYYLLKALENNNRKYLVSSQLYEAIKIPVINNSEQSPIFSAIKNAGDEGGEFIFLIK